MQVLKSTWPLHVRQCSMNLALHFVFKRKHKCLCCCGMFSQNSCSHCQLQLPSHVSIQCRSFQHFLADSYIYLTGDCPHLLSFFMILPLSQFLFENTKSPGLFKPRFWRSPCSDRDHLVRTNQLTQTNPLTQTQADLSQGNWVLQGSFSVELEVVNSCSRYYLQLLQNLYMSTDPSPFPRNTAPLKSQALSKYCIQRRMLV